MISRTRWLIDVETHQKVFLWVLGLLADRELICDERYQTRAMLLTSQLPVTKWHGQIGDPTDGESNAAWTLRRCG